MSPGNPVSGPWVEATRSSVGVDIVKVRRLSALVAEPAKLAIVLTEREAAYCRTRRRPAEHVAARFAAKEAVLKAFGTGIGGGVRLVDVEVVRERSGRPVVELHGTAAAWAAQRGLRAIEVSLSHTGDLAIAHVVAIWTLDLVASSC